jgi:hypothetical protein
MNKSPETLAEYAQAIEILMTGKPIPRLTFHKIFRDNRKLLLFLTSFENQTGILLYHDEGIIQIMANRHKETARRIRPWNKYKLLYRVETNGIGGIHALWGRSV